MSWCRYTAIASSLLCKINATWVYTPSTHHPQTHAHTHTHTHNQKHTHNHTQPHTTTHLGACESRRFRGWLSQHLEPSLESWFGKFEVIRDGVHPPDPSQHYVFGYHPVCGWVGINYVFGYHPVCMCLGITRYVGVGVGVLGGCGGCMWGCTHVYYICVVTNVHVCVCMCVFPPVHLVVLLLFSMLLMCTTPSTFPLYTHPTTIHTNTSPPHIPTTHPHHTPHHTPQQHGLFPCGAGYLPLTPSWQRLMPHIHPVTLTASVIFFPPVIRDLALATGLRQVTRNTFASTLQVCCWGRW